MPLPSISKQCAGKDLWLAWLTDLNLKSLSLSLGPCGWPLSLSRIPLTWCSFCREGTADSSMHVVQGRDSMVPCRL